MSTRGAFILARGNEYKELYIWSDAYPDFAGREAIRLVKTVNLSRAFDHMISCYSGKQPDGEDALYLSLRRVEDAAGSDAEPQYYRADEQLFIYDSISCEYGYLVDLDSRTLEYYTNRQEIPQEGNRFGTKLRPIPHTDVECYPCGLRAVFSFQYIKERETADIVKLMEAIRNERSDEVKFFDRRT